MMTEWEHQKAELKRLQNEWEALVKKCIECGGFFKPSQGHISIAPNSCMGCGLKQLRELGV